MKIIKKNVRRVIDSNSSEVSFEQMNKAFKKRMSERKSPFHRMNSNSNSFIELNHKNMERENILFRTKLKL